MVPSVVMDARSQRKNTFRDMTKWCGIQKFFTTQFYQSGMNKTKQFSDVHALKNLHPIHHFLKKKYPEDIHRQSKIRDARRRKS